MLSPLDVAANITLAHCRREVASAPLVLDANQQSAALDVRFRDFLWLGLGQHAAIDSGNGSLDRYGADAPPVEIHGSSTADDAIGVALRMHVEERRQE